MTTGIRPLCLLSEWQSAHKVGAGKEEGKQLGNLPSVFAAAAVAQVEQQSATTEAQAAGGAAPTVAASSSSTTRLPLRVSTFD
jgi:hypothetical protein